MSRISYGAESMVAHKLALTFGTSSDNGKCFGAFVRLYLFSALMRRATCPQE